MDVTLFSFRYTLRSYRTTPPAPLRPWSVALNSVTLPRRCLHENADQYTISELQNGIACGSDGEAPGNSSLLCIGTILHEAPVCRSSETGETTRAILVNPAQCLRLDSRGM